MYIRPSNSRQFQLLASLICSVGGVCLFRFAALHGDNPLFVILLLVCLVLADDGGGVEGVLLGEFGLDGFDDGGKVGDILVIVSFILLWFPIHILFTESDIRGVGGGSRCIDRGTYVGGLGPVGLWEQFVLVRALLRTTDAVDALVSLLGRKTLEGNLNRFALLLHEVIVSTLSQYIAPIKKSPAIGLVYSGETNRRGTRCRKPTSNPACGTQRHQHTSWQAA